MVQRKAPQKVASQAESRRSHVKLERQASCHQQQDTRSKGGGGGDLKKKMKLERSIRAADLESLQDSPVKKPKKRSPARASPNYMKPTSSSDARKEQVQVTLHAQTATDKQISPRNCKNLSSPKTSSPSSLSPGLKLSKSLSRQSSLKAIRPSLMMKNLKGVVVNRATCSSTLKDSKFPQALDLDPGGTEADGKSVMRVCPYTYCSLNGHRHETLPPLKCFMSARRKLLKTQKSMKLKGLPSLRVKVLGKDKKEIYTGQKATSKVAPYDFFVEIYTTGNPEEQITHENIQAEGETETPQILKEEDQMKESCAETVVEDGLDQSSELSNEEEDVMMSFLEYEECDPQVDDAEEEKTPSVVPEDNGESRVECYVVGLLGKADEGTLESENKVSTFDCNWEEEAGSPFPDNLTECSECPVSKADVEEVDQNVSEMNDAVAPNGGNLEGNDTDCYEGEEFCRVDVLDQTSKPQEPESSEDSDGTCYLCDNKENISDTNSQGTEEVVSEEPLEGGEAEHALLKLDNAESGISKSDSPEEQQNLLKENIKEEQNGNEVEDTNSSSLAQLFYSCDDLKESYQGMPEDESIRYHPEIVFKCDDATEDASVSSDILSCSSNGQSDESDIEDSWESETDEEVSPIDASIAMTKARIRIRRKKITEEQYKSREFNPRPPRFLDVDPDPEAEKVDLRHQLMDERKNSEEYLIDYALRRAVTKLAPARKKKVALLVEAFETVMPLPVCEKSLRHPTSDFIHARVMQACS